jgi:hypothetical protein
LDPTADYKYSKLYSRMDSNLLHRVWTSGDLAFSHGCGISLEDALNEPEISKQILITGTAVSRYHKRFIAQYEYRNYPFYATQYHIEKTVFINNKTNRHLSRNPDLIQFDFEFISAVFEPTRKYGIARSDLPNLIVGRLLEHKRPEKGVFNFFKQAYQFRRRINDKWIKRTYRKQIYEYWRLRRKGITMREAYSEEHDQSKWKESVTPTSRRLEAVNPTV